MRPWRFLNRGVRRPSRLVHARPSVDFLLLFTTPSFRRGRRGREDRVVCGQRGYKQGHAWRNPPPAIARATKEEKASISVVRAAFSARLPLVTRRLLVVLVLWLLLGLGSFGRNQQPSPWNRFTSCVLEVGQSIPVMTAAPACAAGARRGRTTSSA